jgi:ribonucleotide reductase alpha subunit
MSQQQGNNNVMRVQKRDGSSEVVSFDKVINRMRVLSNDLKINIHEIAQKVCSRIFDGVKTSDLDELAAQMCSSLIVEHPDYGILASRIIVSNHHKNTSPSFSETVTTLWNNTDAHGDPNPLVSAEFYNIVMANKEKLNSYIDYQRDYIFDYFGFKTLERAYLTKIGNATIERPQHLFMRVAIGIHGDDIKEALQTYDGMSTKKFIHATPTLFNSGTPVPQQSSCYLLHMKDDSITGIFETLGDCAMISKYAGGIGLNIHQVRARGSLIRGTNGKSDGIIPMLRVFNNTARYVNQSGRRNGSIAVYLEPWHADVEGFLELKKNHGNEEERCRDLFYAMWIPDLFMERVEQNGVWSLMCPDECRGLSDTYGEEFKHLYERYESEGKFRKQIKAQELWFRILQSQIETGTPYMLYKDAANIKSNQKNLGTIKSSNLCVAGDTMILTSTGYHPIASLVNQEVEVWNGTEFSLTKIVQTGADQPLMTVRLSNGTSLKCTPYHKFLVPDGKDTRRVDAKDLTVGTRMVRFDLPVVDASKEEHLKYAHKFFVPINLNITNKLQWLAGVLDGDGCIIENNGIKNIQLASIHHTFLLDVLYLLQTLGVQAHISKSHEERKEYECSAIFRLAIDSNGLRKLEELGLPAKRLDITGSRAPHHITNAYVTVQSLEDEGEHGDTFCFHEPKLQQGVFNGILTGNCTEIVEYTEPNEIAVCNLASICLPSFVRASEDGTTTFSFAKLHAWTKIVTKNLNKVIDNNFYPVDKTARSNFKHRPIGIGIQGLADTFVLMRMPFDSEEARQLNKDIFETMYHASLEQSMEIAKRREELIHELETIDMEKDNDRVRQINKHLNLKECERGLVQYKGAYSSFMGSPAQQGILQFDMWNVQPNNDRYDWGSLKRDIQTYGLRNSLMLAPMPTASTSQIMGFNECFEPFTSNLYKRKTLAGEFIVVNKYLIDDLIHLGLWNKDMKERIIINDGSVQDIAEIPEEVRLLYKTVWEIKQKVIIDMAAERGAFICQSQSMNVFMESPDFKKLSSLHFYAWKSGLKTGMYYLRTKPKAVTQQFTIDPRKSKSNIDKTTQEKAQDDVGEAASCEWSPGCLTCSA